MTVSLLKKQNQEIHQFQDLLNWEKFDWTWEWCSRRTPLIILKLFFVFSLLAPAKSLRPGSVNGVLSTCFKRRVQLGGSGWDNYKLQGVLMSICLPPPTSHLACQFLYNFFVEVFVFNIWVPDLFGCHRIFFFGCHFMPVSSLTNSYVMLFLEQWASSNRAHLCLHSQEDQEFAKSAVIFIPISIEKASQLLDFLIDSITSSGR